MIPKILIVEDDKNTSQLLVYNLQKAGFETVVINDGTIALDTAKLVYPDLIILDQMLPGLDGLEICKFLKRDAILHQIPVVFLTAKGEEIDRILGLELGAEDYIVKPFSPRELILRIKSILNRHSPIIVEHSSRVIQAGDLKVDIARHQISFGELNIELTAMEFKLLTTLLERRGRVQTRHQLLSDVWDISTEIDTRTVDTHIKHLRQKLGAARDKIETIRGVGYRFAEAD